MLSRVLSEQTGNYFVPGSGREHLTLSLCAGCNINAQNQWGLDIRETRVYGQPHFRGLRLIYGSTRNNNNITMGGSTRNNNNITMGGSTSDDNNDTIGESIRDDNNDTMGGFIRDDNNDTMGGSIRDDNNDTMGGLFRDDDTPGSRESTGRMGLLLAQSDYVCYTCLYYLLFLQLLVHQCGNYLQWDKYLIFYTFKLVAFKLSSILLICVFDKCCSLKSPPSSLYTRNAGVRYIWLEKLAYVKQ